MWVCAALGDGDREAVRRGVGEPGVRMLDIDADVHADAYNGIANSVLWFVHHLLYQTPVEPVFDAEFRRQWASFETYNRAFAQALAEEAGEGAAVLVQDYHLVLVPGMLRELRPDLRIGHFSHTPWAPVDYFRMLPDDIAEQVLHGILGADRAAFLTRRWADAFISCCTEILGGTGHTRIGVHGLGADADFLLRRAHEPDVDERMAALREQVGPGRKTIVRVDRTELSKNIVRGMLAYETCSTNGPSGTAGSSTSRSPTPRGRTSRCTGSTRPRCSASPTRSTPSTARRTGPRSSSTSRTTSPARWRRTGWPTWRSSTRSGTG